MLALGGIEIGSMIRILHWKGVADPLFLIAGPYFLPYQLPRS